MGKILKCINKLLKLLIISVYRVFTIILPVNRRIILFECNIGRNYTGNPRAIYEEMVIQGLDDEYKCFFILEDTGINIPGRAGKVKRNRLKYFYLFATCGICICDSRLPMYIIKRKGCTFIQTWHGTPLKKLALDMDTVHMAGETGIDDYKKNFRKNVGTWDYLLSQNSYSTKIFKKAFDYSKDILEIGYPRNDILFTDNNEKIISRLKTKFGLPKDKRIILYAPTWRDDEFYGIGRYKFESGLDFSLLQKELGKDYFLIVKYHYLVLDKLDWSPYKDFILACDLGYDISELYLVSDMLVTDYSSVMFDYSLLRRPIIFYCYDLEDYKDKLRGFYFDFMEEAPGPILKTTEELISSIQRYEYESFRDKYNRFTDKYNHADNGTASKQVVDLVTTIAK